jgi:hypothetical protein
MISPISMSPLGHRSCRCVQINGASEGLHSLHGANVYTVCFLYHPVEAISH